MSADIAKVKATLARAYAAGEEPQLKSVSPSGREEIWMLGSSMFVVPAVPPDAAPELEYALRLRRETSFKGVCDGCGATLDIGSASEDGVGDVYVVHRRNCLAHDDNVAPLLEEHHSRLSDQSVSESLKEASAKTRAKMEELLPNRITLEVRPSVQDWAEGIIDKILNDGDKCGHLRASPAQTWHVLLGTTTFRCDECWVYFQQSIAEGKFRLSALEDLTCDHCRRYAPASLQPLVVRVSNFVLQGGMCGRCFRSFSPVVEE